MIYSNLDDNFFLLDYSPSHKQLLLRSKKNRERNYNIDIIIKGTLNILLPTNIKGVEIFVYNPDNDSKFIKDYKFISSKDYSIFAIKTYDKMCFFINGMCLGVYHNKLDILESSIGRYDYNDLDERIIWFCTNTKTS
ncbi:MAG: hypothetical protein R2730_03415 [Chitinophagales bacterium]